MTACCQITCAIPWLSCEQLPYPPEHPQISRMRQRDKSDLPLPFLSYKYFLLRYSSPILSFYSLKPTFLAAAPFKNFKNSDKDLLQQSSESSILSSSREEMAINFIVPEVNSKPPLLLLPYSCCIPIPLRIYLLSTLFSFLFFQSSNLLGTGR